MKRKAKTHIWHQRHVNDPFVKLAGREGYRSRAAYKLQEIDARDRLLRPGMRIVDLGAAPGGWCQVIAEKLDGNGLVLAIDLLPMAPVPGVTFVEGDFTEDAVYQDMLRRLGGKPVDLVISDIAPNITGIVVADQAKSYALCELALDFAVRTLRPEGRFLIKVFQGAGFEDFMRQMRAAFRSVAARKPQASRDESREVYLLGQGLKVGVADAGDFE
jgi:23S rRNA (uridine2552-2'-O)-methyltransferase